MSCWSRLFNITFLSVAMAYSTCAFALPNVMVKALFTGAVLLDIDGRQHFLKAGVTTEDGVTLVTADSKKATLLIDGKRYELGLNRRVSSHYQKPLSRIVRLSQSHGGHYFSSAYINGKRVQAVVDTGATAVAMNMLTAKRLGLDLNKAHSGQVNTANGVAEAYHLNLASVTVGEITLNNIQGTVVVGDSPTVVLLGNSFLSHTAMKNEKGILLLEHR